MIYTKYFTTDIIKHTQYIEAMHNILAHNMVNDDLCSKSKAIHLHINKLNKKSQSVFTGIGFKVIKMTERGASYSCDVDSIKSWVNL